MAKKVGDYKIPFDKDGNQLHYPGWPIDHWEENGIFTDTLTFLDYSRGRSAAYFHFQRESGKKVTVFMKDFCNMLPFLFGGKITSQFVFIKKGSNYGCALWHG